MNFYPHHLGDYAKDTKDLSMLEHGAYRLLLDHNYATEQPIPNEIDKLYRIAGARTPAELKAVQAVAEKFFPVNGDGRRHNKRAEQEIARLREKSAKAKGSAEARWGKASASPNEDHSHDQTDMRTHSGGNASQEPKPERSKASPANAGEGRDSVATVPDCPHEKLIALYHELLPTCTQVIEWSDARKALMRSRWREKGNAKPGYRTVEDGLAYWRRYFEYVSGSKFLTGKADAAPGRKPFVASLEWLIRPKNFVKVVEGSYHT